MADDPKFNKNLESTVDASMRFTKIILQYGSNEPEKITMALAALAGPMAAISRLVAKDGKNEPVKPEHVLFAGLLVGNAFEPAPDSAVILKMSPAVILDTLRQWESLTGKKGEDWLNEHMVKAANEVEKCGAETFEAFMEAKRQSKMN